MSETNTFQQSVEKTFSPMIDAVKNAAGKFEVPESARDFVKRSAEMAKDRAGDIHTGTVKATDAIENATTTAVSGLAKFSRNVQAAAYDDASAYLNSVGKIASATSFGEAVQIHVDYLRERSDVNMGRAKALYDTVSTSLVDAGKKAQEQVSKVANFSKAA